VSAAYKRIEDLLDRWLASVELHSRYLELDDASYARVQKWPEHQRPTRWVLDLARTRLLDLKQQVASRRDQGDERFAESLELMSLLTNLLGAEHIDRFIPLATKQPDTAASGTVRRPRLKTAEQRAPAKATAAARSGRALSPSPAAKPQAPAAQSGSSAKGVARRAAAAAPQSAIPDAATAHVIADAARFLSWGREWPAIAGLIARLADRPSEAEIWKILRAHRETIEQRARSARD